jgi:hypothetical protein
MNQPWIQQARTWLEEQQNADGGWGETVASYDDPSLRGQGTTTASQTAWALLGLCAFPDVDRRSVREGIDYLVSNQNPDGSWSETLITGTGFPLVFYLKYDMYRNNWPLMALARYRTSLAEAASRAVEREKVLHDRRSSEVSFASTRSSFSSLPVFVFLRNLLTKRDPNSENSEFARRAETGAPKTFGTPLRGSAPPGSAALDAADS